MAASASSSSSSTQITSNAAAAPSNAAITSNAAAAPLDLSTLYTISPSEQCVTLVSKDARQFNVPERIAYVSVTLRDMLQDLLPQRDPIPLTEISGTTLERVIAYCALYLKNNTPPPPPPPSSSSSSSSTSTSAVATPMAVVNSTDVSKYTPHDVELEYDAHHPRLDTPLEPWERQICDIDQCSLFDLTNAANYLHITTLLEASCKIIAERIKGKSTAEIRTMFNIVNDFTPEEEEEMARENTWEYDSSQKATPKAP